MASIGERLRSEREAQDTTIEQMASATGIGQVYLEALERDDIQELPGKAFGKLYIRAYAEVLDFDPRSWIEDYDREQRLVAGASTEPGSPAPAGSRPVAAAIARWKAAKAAESAEPVGEPVPESEDEPTTEAVEAPAVVEDEPAVAPPEVSAQTTPTAPPVKRRSSPFIALGVVAIAVMIYVGKRTTDESEPKRVPSPIPESVPLPAPTQDPVVPPPPPAAKPPAKPAAPAIASAPGSLSVTEFGVGRRVTNLHLEGQDDRFPVGTRVCFATRILGGQAGGTIRHVWIYEGNVEQSIPLRLGGRDYRTHSNKTIGHAGAWAVEARDGQGVVLARVEFTCGPPGPS